MNMFNKVHLVDTSYCMRELCFFLLLLFLNTDEFCLAFIKTAGGKLYRRLLNQISNATFGKRCCGLLRLIGRLIGLRLIGQNQ